MLLRIRQAVYILFAIAAFVLMIVVVTNSQSPESLMSPPEAVGDYKDILNAIENSADNGIILKAPNEGENTTAITFADLNGDKENDAIAFYRLKNDDTSGIYMSVLYKDGAKWSACEPIKGKGNDILEFSYGDLNYDELPEIVVGWNMFDSKDNNTLCVYTLSPDEKIPLIAQADSLIYTKMFVADVCGEGKNEILVIKNNYLKTSSVATASLFELEDAKLKKIDQTDVIPSVQEYKSFQIQKINSKSVFYLDGVVDKQDMITEILYWDEAKGHLLNPIYDSDDGIPTYRSGSTVPCTDINSDGIIEIPFMIKSDEERYISLTEWKQFEMDGFRSIKQGVCSDELLFIFPDNWNHQVSVKQDGNVWTFYDTDNDEKLFDLLACDISESAAWREGNEDKAFEIVKIDYGTAYGVRFSSSDSSLSLSKNEIKDAIINIR